jgi:hypothetical protein
MAGDQDLGPIGLEEGGPMDLLACSECECRFYVPGVVASDGRHCPQCGGDLAVVVERMASIPLDARWLDPRVEPPFEVTVVEVRRKRARARENGQRIVKELADYFPVKVDGHSLQVSVNRGAAADAALRVAAILDGVDSGWEEHFFLPRSYSGVTSDDPSPPPNRARGHLRLVPQTRLRGAAEAPLRGFEPRFPD